MRLAVADPGTALLVRRAAGRLNRAARSTIHPPSGVMGTLPRIAGRQVIRRAAHLRGDRTVDPLDG